MEPKQKGNLSNAQSQTPFWTTGPTSRLSLDLHSSSTSIYYVLAPSFSFTCSSTLKFLSRASRLNPHSIGGMVPFVGFDAAMIFFCRSARSRAGPLRHSLSRTERPVRAWKKVPVGEGDVLVCVHYTCTYVYQVKYNMMPDICLAYIIHIILRTGIINHTYIPSCRLVAVSHLTKNMRYVHIYVHIISLINSMYFEQSYLHVFDF